MGCGTAEDWCRRCNLWKDKTADSSRTVDQHSWLHLASTGELRELAV